MHRLNCLKKVRFSQKSHISGQQTERQREGRGPTTSHVLMSRDVPLQRHAGGRHSRLQFHSRHPDTWQKVSFNHGAARCFVVKLCKMPLDIHCLNAEI